ncbi:MAG: peptidoglycan DD-metalloendopeptidase family protein [Oscillospiraceae bacterium]|nr:peptidoglycan DD-metalloendopeptidase family protein [Oscillospiraceae bacterium]
MDNLNNFGNNPENSSANNADVLSGVRVRPAKRPFYIVVIMAVADFFYSLGKSICEIIIDMVNGVLLLTGRVIGYVWSKTENFRLFLLGQLKYLGIILLSPLVKLHSNYSRMKNDFRLANRENGLKAAIPAFFKHVFYSIFGKRGAAITIFNYAAPVLSVIFLVNLISYATDINYAVRLEVNGQFVGYIDNELVFTEAQQIFERRLNVHGSATIIEVTPHFSIEKVERSEILNSLSVANALMDKTGVSVDYAFGVTISNTLIGAVKDNEPILEALDALLDVHRTGAPDEVVAFEQHIDANEAGLFLVESIIDPDEIIRSITQIREDALYYVVEDDDNVYSISESLGVRVSELERLNPGILNSTLYTGQRIMYSAEVPTLPVSVTRTEVYENATSYATEYRDDDSRFTGTSYVSVNGESGIERVEARVTLVNGVETGRAVISRQTVSEPVTRVVLQGTRPIPTDNPISDQTSAYGMFIHPLGPGREVAEWHWRDGGYSGHSGIDFGAPYGTAIFAAGSGEVVFSGWNYGYGNCVIIEHENGLRTLYGHASALLVKVGQQVSQGETIALVGSTGESYGNHLHFEVREGGIALNPRPYIDFG